MTEAERLESAYALVYHYADWHITKDPVALGLHVSSGGKAHFIPVEDLEKDSSFALRLAESALSHPSSAG